MARYKKVSSRIPVKYVDANTEDIIFEVPNRNWTNIGELMADVNVNDLIMRELAGKKLPNKIIVLAVAEFELGE